MNDRRFKELLNLYLDHEISPEEAAALEQEVRSSPERKRTFDSYCKLQKGCTVLFENNRVNAPAADALKKALVQANQRMATRPATTHRSFWLAGSSLAALAAAACIAFVVGRPTAPTDAARSTVAKVEAPKAAVELRTSPALVKDARIPAVFASTQNASYNHADRVAETLKWTENVQFRPIRKVDSLDMAFTGKVQLQQDSENKTEADALNGSPSEMTALQFKR